MSSAREDMLGRIRRAAGSAEGDREEEYAAITREYVQVFEGAPADLVETFIDRLQDYVCAVRRCSRDEISATINSILRERSKRRLLIPPGVPQDWCPEELEFIHDDGLSYETLDNAEGVLTGCALGIALTGTIVLKHSREEGRRAATLIPDYHLCVVFEEQLVGTVPESTRAMSAFGSAPMTAISGPSATSDIEMTRIKGVHGPRTLDVVLVRRAQT